MVQLALKSVDAGFGAQAVASLVRRALTSLDADPGTARQYLIHAETLLDLPKPAARWDGLAPWQAKRVAAHIEANLGDHLTLTDVAQLARLSTSYFSRGFKRTFGVPFLRFVTRKRVERAQTLMTTTELRLCDIAYATGFADQSHFSRAFLQVTGATPARWRRQTAGPRDANLPDLTSALPRHA